MFVLAAIGEAIGFAANLFGNFENVVLVDDSGAFWRRLPGMADGFGAGVVWTTDPVQKVTRGPTPLLTAIRAAADP